MNLYFPYQFDGTGSTRQASNADYLNGLIQQVLFTSPGERVNQPEFGSGLLQSVFGPNSDQMAAATQFIVQSGLQKWLGSLIVVEAVQVTSQDSVLTVTVQYLIRQTQARQVQTFTSGGSSS